MKLIKCDLCSNEYPPVMMIAQDNGDVYCKVCDDGVKMDEMKVKPIKKDKPNGLIQSNFGASLRKIIQ
jgi:hypothetical protein